jgi:hypothetical protein
MEPVIYHVRVPLRVKDDRFMHIQEVIDAKRNLLLKKQKKLKFISEQNHFLEEVQKDYSQYYSYIAEQKNNQIQALMMLQNYISDLTKSEKLTKNNIKDAKEEQKKIYKEINSIKHGLNSIIGNTDYVNSILKEKTQNEI